MKYHILCLAIVVVLLIVVIIITKRMCGAKNKNYEEKAFKRYGDLLCRASLFHYVHRLNSDHVIVLNKRTDNLKEFQAELR